MKKLSKEEKEKLVRKADEDYTRRCELIWDDTLGELEDRFGITEEEVDRILDAPIR